MDLAAPAWFSSLVLNAFVDQLASAATTTGGGSDSDIGAARLVWS